MAKRNIIQIKDLKKVYDLGAIQVEALKGLNFDIEEGSYTAIMGPSGSGKSTLLNILGCLDRPSSGAYILGDDDVAHMDDRELSGVRGSRIGFIFQSYNLIQQLNVVENIHVPLFYQGKDISDHYDHCVKLAEKVGLAERLDHRPMQLSGGQQRAWPWRARWSMSRSCCWPTNPPAIWIPPPSRRFWISWMNSMAKAAHW